MHNLDNIISTAWSVTFELVNRSKHITIAPSNKVHSIRHMVPRALILPPLSLPQIDQLNFPHLFSNLRQLLFYRDIIEHVIGIPVGNPPLDIFPHGFHGYAVPG